MNSTVKSYTLVLLVSVMTGVVADLIQSYSLEDMVIDSVFLIGLGFINCSVVLLLSALLQYIYAKIFKR